MTLRQAVRGWVGALVPRTFVNLLLRWTRTAVGPVRFDVLMGRGHRQAGYRLLSGRGIEIGALHAPAVLPRGCSVVYVDAISTEEARRLFPEVDAKRLVPVAIVTDLDTQGLAVIENDSMDFAVMNHVIEHVANPVNVVGELFRVVRLGGLVVISAPDMRFSFDRYRPLTSLEHVLEEYVDNVTSVGFDHYEEVVRLSMPEPHDPIMFREEVQRAQARKEHAHVWNSQTFEEFLRTSIREVGIEAQLIHVSTGNSNGLEHFSVWSKKTNGKISAIATFPPSYPNDFDTKSPPSSGIPHAFAAESAR